MSNFGNRKILAVLELTARRKGGRRSKSAVEEKMIEKREKEKGLGVAQENKEEKQCKEKSHVLIKREVYKGAKDSVLHHFSNQLIPNTINVVSSESFLFVLTVWIICMPFSVSISVQVHAKS